jgi:drug/metabolite transporter (DMT)-like permease
MEHIWILFAVLAALLQAIRTAAQRDLNRHLSALATTYVRSLFGLPVLAVYLLVVLVATGEGAPRLSAIYLAWTLSGALSQVLATVLLIIMFTLRSFGVGTMLTKVDIVMTALLGALLFSETLTAGGVLALLVVMIGVVFMSLERTGVALGKTSVGRRPSDMSLGARVWDFATDRSIMVALGCALSFSISYLSFREATLTAGPGSFVWRAAWTVLIAIFMQTVIVGAWLAWREPKLVSEIGPHLRLSAFIGTVSAVGSILWFTAFALQNASYVRAVGQVEVVFTLLVSAFYFKERISALEYAGIALTVAGVVLFRLVA